MTVKDGINIEGMTDEEVNELETAYAITMIGIFAAEDLPDGMGEEIQDCFTNWKQSARLAADHKTLIKYIKEICEDWGFPFN